MEGHRVSQRAGRHGEDKRRALFVWSTLVTVPFRPDMCFLVIIGLTMPSIAYTGSASHNYIICLVPVGV